MSKDKDKHKVRKTKKRKAKESESSSGEEDTRRQSSSSSSKKSKKHKKKHTKEKRDKKDTRSKRRESTKGHNNDHVEVDIQITEADYFSRSTDFRVWLMTKRKTNFEDLTSKESHSLFAKFIKDWNLGKLEGFYYEGRIPEELQAKAKKTQHKWGFVKKLSDQDQMRLASAQDSVHSSTEKVKGVKSNVPISSAVVAALAEKKPSAAMPPPLPPPSSSSSSLPGEGRPQERSEAKRRRGMEREKHAVVLDELAPRETGRQAMLDKRRETGARMHASAREREEGRDGLDMREADVMGGGDGFQERLAREKALRHRRGTVAQARLSSLAAQEDERRLAFMAQMGIKAGQKITIQPRKDG
ncbi:unnamed protein product [Discosporangium mesarthrocarpum]